MTARSEIEAKLLLRRFPTYKGKVRELVSFDMSAATARLEDSTVAAVWNYCRPRFSDLEPFAPRGESTAWKTSYRSGRLDTALVELLVIYYEAAWSYERSLEEATDEQIKSGWQNLAQDRKARRETAAKDHDEFAWFNDPNCDLDVDHWNEMQGVTADEATAIALGKDPRRVQAENLRPFYKVSRSLFTERYAKLLRSAEAFAEKKGPNGKLSWAQLLQWAATENIVIASHRRQVEFEPEGDGIDTRIGHSLYRLLFGVCLAHYGRTEEDSDKQVSAWLAALRRDLNDVGISIDRKTVLDRLREAYGYMVSRKDWPPKPRIKR